MASAAVVWRVRYADFVGHCFTDGTHQIVHSHDNINSLARAFRPSAMMSSFGFVFEEFDAR